MTVGLDHPVVDDYLHRLDAAATALPPGRREELVAEIRGHVAEALAEAGRDDEATVRSVLDRIGEPQDIVAAELESTAPQRFGGPGVAVHDMPAFPGGPGGFGGSAGAAVAAPSQWGALEIVAVLGLTVGMVILPVVGAFVGIACAWLSTRWTRREKIVATVWGGAAPALLVLGVAALIVVRSAS
jgi:hypothetical protein